MAELPRYQETGRIYSDLPSFDFANVKESIKFSQSISKSLDRLSEFAQKTAEKDAERKAEEFAIENPITLDDLKKAETSGLTANDLVKATGGGTIWQETLRKFQASQLRTQLEVTANTAALDILNQVKMRQLTDPNEITAKFESMQKGMVKPLESLDPETALQFKASSGALIKNLHKQALDKVYEEYVLDKKVETGNYVNVALEAVNSIYETEVDPEVVKSRLIILRRTLSDLAKEGGADFAFSTIQQFDKDVQEKKVNQFINVAIKDDFAKNPTTGLRDENIAMLRMVNGDFGESSALFDSLDPKEKAIVRSSYLSRERDRIAVEKQVQEEQTLKDIQDVNNLEQDFFNSGRRDKSVLRKLEEIVRRNPKALTAEALERIKKGDADDAAKLQFSSAAITLKERIRTNPNMSWEQVTIEGKQLGLGQDVINRYIYPVFRSDTEREYDRQLNRGAVSPAGSIPTFLKNQTLINDSDAVNNYITSIVEKNKNLQPGEKPTPVPNKIEALEIIRKKQASSPATADIKTTINEVGLYIKTRKIKNITIDENSSLLDNMLVSQIDRQDSKGKFILSDEDRKYLKTQLQIIDNARAAR